MKSITIHGIDDETSNLIQQRAQVLGLSLNKTIKKILNESLQSSSAHKRADFSEFFGVWTKEETKEFEKAIKDTERIDPEDWK